jgi:hypothetical protein
VMYARVGWAFVATANVKICFIPVVRKAKRRVRDVTTLNDMQGLDSTVESQETVQAYSAQRITGNWLPVP